MKRKPKAVAQRDRDEGEIPELTAEDFKRARPAREVLPKIFPPKVAAEMLKPRGRPKTAHAKVSVTVRYSREVLEYFKATGPGWQTRMDEVLKKWVARQPS